MSGLGAKDILRNITALEQLIEEINFQRAKEMRQCLMSKDSDSGFVMVQGTTYWTDLFVRHFLFQTDRSTDADDLLFFIRKRPLKGSKYIPKYQTEVEVYRKDSRKLPIGDPDIDWEETVYLNLIIHQFDYTLTLAVCTRTSPKELQVLKRHSQKVYASPSRRRMDTKGEVEEITYPNVCFHVDNFDEVFADMLVRDGEMVCVELVASDHAGSRQAVIFLGSIRYDALKRVYDTRASLSSKMAQRMMLGLFNNSGNQRIEFVRMKGPQGKGHAEMAVTKPKGSGVETPTSEPGVSLTDMWDSDWEDEPEDRFMYRHQRRLSDPSANFNTFINSGWKARHEGARSRSENEGLDCFADGLYEIESGDVRDAVCSGRCCSVVACKTIQEEEEEEAGKGVMCDRCQRLHGQTVKLPSSQCSTSQEASPVEVTGKCQEESSPESTERHDKANVHSTQMELDQHSVCNEVQSADSEPDSPTLSRGSSRSAKKFPKGIYHPLATSDDEELSARCRHLIDSGTSQVQNEYEQSTKYRKIPGLARRVSHREELRRKTAPSVSKASSLDTAIDRKLPDTVDQLSADKSVDNEAAAVSPRRSLQLESETFATEATSLLDLTVATDALTSLDVKQTSSSRSQSDINSEIRSSDHVSSHCVKEKQLTDIVTGVPCSSSRSQMLDLYETQLTQKCVSPSSGDSTHPQLPCTSSNNSEIQIETGVEEGITLDDTTDAEDPVDAAVEVDGEEAHVGRVSHVCNASPLPPSSFPAARATAVATSLADADAAQATTADGARDGKSVGVSLAKMYTANKSSGKSKKVSVPYRTTVEGTTVYFLCDIKLDDGAYNPLWTTRGFTQTFHFWKESRRAQSVPLNAYLTYVTLPWFTIITDILDHSTGPILTF